MPLEQHEIGFMQVLNMFEKAEAEYETLTEKKRIVNNDKSKIEKASGQFAKCIIMSYLRASVPF